MRSIWGRSATHLGPIWCRSGVDLRPIRVASGADPRNRRSIWGRSGAESAVHFAVRRSGVEFGVDLPDARLGRPSRRGPRRARLKPAARSRRPCRSRRRSCAAWARLGRRSSLEARAQAAPRCRERAVHAIEAWGRGAGHMRSKKFESLMRSALRRHCHRRVSSIRGTFALFKSHLPANRPNFADADLRSRPDLLFSKSALTLAVKYL